MRKVWCCVGLVVILASPVWAQNKEQQRVENSGTVMKEILNAPESIPQGVLDKADCVVVLPSVVKFAIGIGGSYGRGVMTCRSGKQFQGKWGTPTRSSYGLCVVVDEPKIRVKHPHQQSQAWR